MPTARDGLGVAVVGGILYAVGGMGSSGTNLQTVESYDPGLNSWTSVAPMPPAYRQLTRHPGVMVACRRTIAALRSAWRIDR